MPSFLHPIGRPLEKVGHLFELSELINDYLYCRRHTESILPVGGASSLGPLLALERRRSQLSSNFARKLLGSVQSRDWAYAIRAYHAELLSTSPSERDAKDATKNTVLSRGDR